MYMYIYIYIYMYTYIYIYILLHCTLRRRCGGSLPSGSNHPNQGKGVPRLGFQQSLQLSNSWVFAHACGNLATPKANGLRPTSRKPANVLRMFISTLKQRS